MGERKVLNKYIPADFNPALVPRGKKPTDGLIPVRMMLPFSIQCSTCSTFLYRGRKFNSKKEPVKGPEGKYLGIQRFRFYIKCGGCSRPISFLTDPKNADYEMESGGTRNYEVWHDERKTNEQFEKETEEDEKLDGMKALENRVLESQREMAELDALEEIRAMNARHVKMMGRRVGGNGSELDAAQAVLNAREANLGLNAAAEEDVELNENGLTHEEEELVSSIKFGKVQSAEATIHRLDEQDELLAEQKRRDEAEALILNKRKDNADSNKIKSMPVIIKKKKRKIDSGDDDKTGAKAGVEKKAAATSTPVGLSGLLGYGTSSDSD